MCRLFGQISPIAVSARDFLVDSERSLLRQSDFRPGNLQRDGWGIGVFEGGRAKVIKSPRPAFEERSKFEKAAESKSKVVIGHLRAASNPSNLSQSRLIGQENTQPFTDGKIVFAHNGTLQIHEEIKKGLGPLQRNIKGVNDSEVYFWLFMKHHRELGDAPAALAASVREIWKTWDECRNRYKSKKAPYTGLNTLVGDGSSLHAMCHYPYGPVEGQGSIFSPAQPWGIMSFGRRGSRLILASEDLDSGPWGRLADAQIVSAFLKGGRIQTRRTTFAPRGN